MTLKGPALVTGALGQDGFILSYALLARGVEVVGVVRPGASGGRRRMLEALGCRLVEIDLTAPAPLGPLTAEVKPGSIFHLAAAHLPSSAAEIEEVSHAMTAVNQRATEVLAAAARDAGAALVYASSSQIWAATKVEQMVDETTPSNPSTFYGRTKVAAGEMLAHHRAHDGLRASVAILFNHESPWRAPSFVTRMISMAAAKAARGEAAPLALMNIGARADWHAAADTTEALMRMAGAPVPGDYVIASGRSHAVKDFVAAAYDYAGVPWQGLVSAARDEPGPVLVGNAAKARRELGWQPAIAFGEIARAMVDADMARLDGAFQHRPDIANLTSL